MPDWSPPLVASVQPAGTSVMVALERQDSPTINKLPCEGVCGYVKIAVLAPVLDVLRWLTRSPIASSKRSFKTIGAALFSDDRTRAFMLRYRLLLDLDPFRN